MNSVKLNNLSLKYQRFTPSGCKDVGTRKFEFVTKTQILYGDIKILDPNSMFFVIKFIDIYEEGRRKIPGTFMKYIALYVLNTRHWFLCSVKIYIYLKKKK